MTAGQRRAGARRRNSIAAAIVALMAMLFAVVTPVVASGAPLPLLTLDKWLDADSATEPVVVPGQPFNYVINVGCSQDDCQDAVVTDVLPPELDGFVLSEVVVNQTGGGTPLVTWNGASAQPATIGSDTQLTVTPQHVVAGAATGLGLAGGQGVTVTLTLQVPSTLQPTWAHAGETITNTATATATNSLPVSDTADVVVEIAPSVSVGTAKDWTPSSAPYSPGTPSTIALGVTNTSNVPASSMTLQEPQDAVDGATSLAASNAFTLTDLTDLAGRTLPAGATAATVDAYVFDGAVWSWVSGTPGTSLTLPTGVAAADVAGLRVTYTGEIEPGASGGFDLTVAQRSTHRGTGATLAGVSSTVANVAVGSVTAEGETRESTDQASYAITPVALGVGLSKDIVPAQVLAGESASATIVATNTRTGVNCMAISDLDYFTQGEVTFGGFTELTAPATATGATVVWHTFDGGALAPAAFTPGELPVPPVEPAQVSGFVVTWTAADGGIAGGSTSRVVFDIDTTGAATGDAPRVTTTNDASVTVVGPDGRPADATARDTLVIIEPAIDVTLTKQVRPSTPVFPGDTVIATLTATATTTSPVAPGSIVVTDSIDTSGDRPGGGFWNAFNLRAVEPTGIPAGTSLLIEVQVAGAWTTLASYPAAAEATTIRLTNAEIAAAVGDPTQITGIRFTYAGDALPTSTTVRPNLAFDARETLRSGGPTDEATLDEADPTPTTYDNVATATGTSGDLTETATAEDSTPIIRIVTSGEGGPGGALAVSKAWSRDTVSAQSGDRASTLLSWRAQRGFETVTISDHGDGQGSPAGTVFDAFNLTGIDAIGASTTPFTNGWYLRWDAVTAVELWDGSAWAAASCAPSAPGTFAGCALTPAEQASTQGVRLVLAENTAGREAAIAAGEVGVPAPGSGVAATSGTGMRSFNLGWQLRNTLRSDSSTFLSPETVLNGGAGSVVNVVRVTGVRDGVPVSTQDSDTIVIVKGTINVEVSKSATPTTPLVVPPAGTAPEGYPTATFTSTARNIGTVLGSYVRLTDPALCSDTAVPGACRTGGTAADATADPFAGGTVADWLTGEGITNPFEHVDLTKVTFAASIPGEVDLAVSTVYLLHADGTVTTTTAAAANALAAPALADVIGISVTFQGSDPATTGGTISGANVLTMTAETRLRATQRSDGAPIAVVPNTTQTVTNSVFGQLYDPILNADVSTGDAATADIRLSGGTIGVTASKAVTPSSLIQAAAGDTVEVALGGASSASSAVAPTTVSLTDTAESSPEFWSRFDLVALGAVTAPGNADQARVGVLTAAGWEWSGQQALGALGLPAGTDPADALGVSVIFSRADGGFLASPWSASVGFTAELRAEHRDLTTGGSTGVPLDYEGVTVRNTAVVVATRGVTPVTASAEATVTLTQGTRQLAVNKLANDDRRAVDVGVPVPWDLTFTNTGTGILTITGLSDDPGDFLVVSEPSDTVPAPTYTTSAGGTLATVGVAMSVDPATGDVSFVWPDGGSTMQPGETFTVRLYMQLSPGRGAGELAVNTMTVATAEPLSACTWLDRPTTAASPGVIFDPEAPTSCGTTDYVTPSPTLNLYMVKGVQGALGTATNVTTGDACMAPSISSGGQQFFGTPCLADSTYSTTADVTDSWVLRTANTMTNPVESLVLFDSLPVPGDQRLIGGAPRGSTYQPVVDPSSIVVDVQAGGASLTPTVVIEATTDAVPVCENAWDELIASSGHVEVCSEQTWVDYASVTDFAAVTGLRISLDFGDAPLPPGGIVDVRYDSHNVAATEALPTGAPATVPASDVQAWNQFGGAWQWQTSRFSERVVAEVGVHLRVGPLQVEKVVTGPLATYAPATIQAQVVCELPQPDGTRVTLDMGEHATVTLVRGEDGTYAPAVVPGIPVGAECVVTEQGELGSYGETGREVVPEGAVVIADSSRAGAEGEVPEAQVVVVTNDYAAAAPITLTKKVVGDAPSGASYTVQVACTTVDGAPVVLGASGATVIDVEIAADETVVIGEGLLPVGATCVLTETVTGGAVGTTVEVTQGDTVVTAPGTSGSVTVGRPDRNGATVVVTNTFDELPPTSPPASPPTTPPPGKLPHTGADVAVAGAAALALLAAGAVLVARRRRQGPTD